MTATTDDGDIVRGYGMVAIRFGRLEDAVDRLLEHCEGLIVIPNRVKNESRFSYQVKFLEKKIIHFLGNDLPNAKLKIVFEMSDGVDTEIPPEEFTLNNLRKMFKDCKSHGARRNNILHSPIFPTEEDQAKLVRCSNPTGVREVSSGELYDFADEISRTIRRVIFLGLIVHQLKEQRRNNFSPDNG